MKITLNGETRELVPPYPTLDRLLADSGFSGTIATAVNEVFVPAAERAETPLHEGDRIEVLAPMQGG
ncbi:thiamine biosynthesis protein ThiS [Brevirhabdus pacifica]|uniref:Thiamine biosynthesis protein ThiS n=1 Tax=Brevirhabdus pacifica TaxID=1267768 RepID=A0A1U7DLC3_9RHOB|nr:sulfur carrier protein ThiS [Brevirhabdus pacifica]APX90771.1 thiamine biosynthesis protein ThiS [Brevirhabdus pacifica]OWU79557.1 hypothetical protein ATO5_00185 [Loktanella sp. 22II-4b]PJJ87351.1 sulfur carrier protein [Brevirhabdus pacifica]